MLLKSWLSHIRQAFISGRRSRQRTGDGTRRCLPGLPAHVQTLEDRTLLSSHPFTDISAGLPGVGFSSAAWGDFDSDGAATETTFDLTVNDAPVADDDAYSVNEDTTLTVAAATGVLDGDTDVDGDSLTAVLDIGPSNGTLTLNANGSFTYAPNANCNGSDSFTYHANDGNRDSNPTDGYSGHCKGQWQNEKSPYDRHFEHRTCGFMKSDWKVCEMGYVCTLAVRRSESGPRAE